MPTLAAWLEAVWYSPSPPPRALRLLAPLYGAIAESRRRRLAPQAAELRAQIRVPVVVVGNLTVGGAGKTPLVAWLVERLRASGRRPGVISRGYGRRGAAAARVDGHSDVAQVGDEPLLLAQHLCCPVAVAAQRVQAALLLLRETDVDVLVADDGLQHHALPRDLEIVVVDGARGLGNGWLLPAGPLREPAARLHDVDLVVVNGGDWRPPAGIAVARMALAGAMLRSVRPGETLDLARLRGETVHAAAGIGNPQRFFDTLRAAGLTVIPHAFPDHHRYREADLAFGDGLPLVMTEKDAVKCRAFARPGWWQLPVTAQLADSDAAAVQKLLDRLPR